MVKNQAGGPKPKKTEREGGALSEAARRQLHELVAQLSGEPESGVPGDDGGEALVQRLTALVTDLQTHRQALIEQNAALEREIAERQVIEARYRLLFEHANDAIFIENDRDEIVDANLRAGELLGYSREELLTLRVPDLQAPEIRGKVGTVVAAETAQGEPFEGMDLHRDGRRIPVEVTTARLGDTGLIFSIVRDISERKRIEEGLRKNEERYRMIFEHAPLGFIQFNQEGVLVDCNDRLADIMGVPREQLLGFDMLKSMRHEALRQQIFDALTDVPGKIHTYEGEYIPVIGDRRPMVRGLFTRLVGEKGEFLGGFAIVEDITERRETERSLERLSRQMQSILDAAGEGIFGVNSDGRTTFVNRATAQMLGWEPAELLGCKIHDVIHHSRADGSHYPARECPISASYRDGTIHRGDDEVFWHKEEGAIPVEYVSTPLWEGETLAGAVVVFSDISERKRREQEQSEAYQYRAQQVQIGTEVAQEIAAAQGLNDLFQQVVVLIKERFGYYHVELFHYEAALNALLLVSGYGAVGEQMVASGHRLAPGQGAIGRAAVGLRSELIPDMAQEPGWVPHPLLPETRGELAVPIRFRGQLLGVLGVQSDRAGGLTQDDRLLMEGICGQIAIVFEDIRLRQEMQARLHELDTAYQAMSREGWDVYRATAKLLPGYQYDLTGLKSAEDLWLPEIGEAVRRGNLIPPTGESEVTVAPLKVLGGEVIGVLGVHDDPRQPLSAEDLGLVSAVSEQVALALENARLFEQARAERSRLERLYEVGRRLVGATTLDEVGAVVLDSPTYVGAQTVDLLLFEINGLPYFRTNNPERAEWPADRVRAFVQQVSLHGLQGWVCMHREAVLIPETRDDGRWLVTDGESSQPARSVICVPLIDREGQVLGSLSYLHGHPRAFGAAELEMAKELGSRVAVALESAGLLEQTREVLVETQELYGASAELNSAATYADVLAVMREHTVIGEADRAAVLGLFNQGWTSVDEVPEWVIPAARWAAEDLAAAMPERTRIQFFSRITEMFDNEIYLFPKVAGDSRITEEGQHILQEVFKCRSLMLVPLMVGDERLGFLQAMYGTEREFASAELQQLAVLAQQSAVMVQSLQQRAQIRHALEEAEVLYKVGQEVTRAESMEDILRATVRLLEFVGMSGLTILVGKQWDEDLNPHEMDVYNLMMGPEGIRTRALLGMPPSDSRMGGIFSEPDMMVVYSKLEGASDPMPESVREILLKQGNCWMLMVGLMARGHPLGFLSFTSRQPLTDISERAIHVPITTVAEQLAMSVDNRLLFEETRRRAESLEKLSQVESAISRATTEEEILEALVSWLDPDPEMRGMLNYLDCDAQGVPQTTALVAMWQQGALVRESPMLGKTFPLHRLPSSQLWLGSPDTVLMISDLQNDPRVDLRQVEQMGPTRIRAITVLPLHSGGRWQGALVLQWAHPRLFTEEEQFIWRALLESVAAVVASRRAVLEQRAARREIEVRALQLQTAAEISRAASSILNLNDLLPQAAELIQQRFEYYYVGIFLVDEARKWAVLRAGTGEAGQAMLSKGHRLEVGGNSMIGSCVIQGTAKVAFDVGEEAVRFDNPLLPETRSEIAMPLLSRGKVIGAMSIQSTQAAAFSAEDITVLQTMADQLANAIENARLLQASDQTVRQLEAAYGQYTLESWRGYSQLHRQSGYQYRGLGVEPAGRKSPEAEEAWRQGRSVVSVLPTTGAGGSAMNVLAVPIKLRNQVIGVLNLRSENTKISKEVVGLVEEVANRLALSLENARLLEESRQRVAREQTLNLVSERFSSSLDIDTMLQTAVRELGKLPRVAEVSVHMGLPESPRADHEGDEEER